jgi:putative dimethyl sulfoxide reductase chaperone
VNFFDDDTPDRSYFYKLFSPLFLRVSDDETLEQIKDIFEIKFGDSSDEIQIDFSYLFSDTGGRLPPYESLYNYSLADKPRPGGTAAKEVEALYEATGINIDEDIELVPDHLSAELFFMSYLIENDLIEEQKFFLENHLLVWVPDYCDEIKRIARTSFYKRIAELLTELILDECEEFGIETAL